MWLARCVEPRRVSNRKSPDRRFQFHRRSQLFIGAHDKPLSVTMCAHNPNCSPFDIQSRYPAQAPTDVAQIVKDDFQYFTRRLYGAFRAVCGANLLSSSCALTFWICAAVLSPLR